MDVDGSDILVKENENKHENCARERKITELWIRVVALDANLRSFYRSLFPDMLCELTALALSSII